MSNEPAETSAADDLDQAEPTPLAKQAEDPSPARRGGLLPLISIVLLLAAAAGAYYWYTTMYRADIATLRDDIATLAERQATVNPEVQAAMASVGTLSEDIAGVGSGLDGLGSRIDGVASTQQQLQRSIAALYEEETQTSADWVLAEAEYLVLAATQRLALEKDVETASAALRAADQRLKAIEHPDLIPVREQIIKDITALESVNAPDLQGLAIYIAEAIGQVERLPTKAISQDVTPFENVREGEFEARDWRRVASAVWSDLTDLVEVKDADLPDSVLFDPELRYFLQQNLKLELASARLAVLNRDSDNLQASADLIKNQLNAYYDTADAGVATILKRLDEATKFELSPALPNITGSLDVIRQRRQSQASAAEAGTPQ